MANKKPESLYELELPGKVTVKFWKSIELSPARRRDLEVYSTYMFPLLQRLRSASAVEVDGVTVDPRSDLPGLPVGLTLQQTRDLLEMNDVAGVTFLKSWTARETIKDADGNTIQRVRPLPTTVEEFRLIPSTLFDPIRERAAKIMFAEESDFTLDSIDDPESPTTP